MTYLTDLWIDFHMENCSHCKNNGQPSSCSQWQNSLQSFLETMKQIEEGAHLVTERKKERYGYGSY